MTTLALARSDALPRTDALVVGTAPAPRGGVTLVDPPRALRPAARRALVAALTAVGATGKPGDVVKVPGAGIAEAAVVVGSGLGPDTGRDAEALARAAGAAVRALAGTRRVALALPAATPVEQAATAMGGLLGAYDVQSLRRTPAAARPVRALTLLVPEPRDRAARELAARTRVVADAVKATRDLVNTPPSHLVPAGLAAAAADAVSGLPVTVEVLDEKALRRGGYGGLTAVGQGSANPPRLVRLAYRPDRSAAHLALVGKGITFDSGGLSIKPAAGMEAMKSDMAGAAAVLGATVAIARLGLPVAVTTYLAIAENLPSGSAQRPSDVITVYGGTTVEVVNTDAEGRLVLADALVRAAEDAPDVVVDVATLTGAQQIALGNRVSAVMANDDSWRDAVVAAATAAGESFWPMPLPADLRSGLDSPVADLKNLGERWGGMLTAGVFLQEFVPADLRWAHVDIAGPSFNEGQAYGYTPVGGTGVAVRALVQLTDDLAT